MASPFELPFQGKKIGTDLSKYYQSSLGNLSQMQPFGESFLPDYNAGMQKTLSSLNTLNPESFTDKLYSRGKTALDKSYGAQRQGLKENMFQRGFGNSSSNVLMQDTLNQGYTRDLADLLNNASLTGQSLYNNSLGSLINTGTFFTNAANNPMNMYYDLSGGYGNALSNLIGRQTDMQNNMYNVFSNFLGGLY